MKISLDPFDSTDIKRIIIDPIAPVAVCRAKNSSQIHQNNLFLIPKVISRQHAILYEKDHQVYVKDTKSSGGTWVNGKRLSKAGVESSPVVIRDEDIIQFGEDTEFNEKIMSAVKFKVYIEHGQVIKSQDNLSPEAKIKLVAPANVDLPSPILESPTSGFLERNKSWIDPITPIKKSLLDPSTVIESPKSQVTNQDLPALPTLPDHIQEELNNLWTSLDKIALPFKEAEILLKKS